MPLTEAEELELLTLERERSGAAPQIQSDSVNTPPSPQSQNRALFEKAKQMFSLPEKKAKEGLTAVADAIPVAETEDVTTNMLLNTPKLATEVAAETAPGFISPESLALMGGGAVLKGVSSIPPIRKGIEATGKAIGRGLEGLSGLEYKTPGVLAEAFNDPGLFFSRGIESARKFYEKAKGVSPQVRQELKETLTKSEFVQKALDAAKAGNLQPVEALEARKTLTSIKKSIPDAAFYATRDIFDTIAKQNFGLADEVYSRAVRADALRNFFPQNKLGGSSVMKTSVGQLVPQMLGLMSPFVQGAAATAAGGVTRALAKPVLGAGAGAVNRQRFDDEKKKRGYK